MTAHEGSAHNRNHLQSFPPELVRRIEADLTHDEAVLWAGQPRPDLFARGSIFLVIFGLFFAGFAVLWMALPVGAGLLVTVGGAASKEPSSGLCGVPFLCFGLFGVPFFLIGCGLATSPIWRRRLAARTGYVLTDRRALVFEAGLFGRMTVRSYRPHALDSLTREENPDGSGSLIFQTALVNTGRSVSTQRYGFLCIDDVARVEDLIRERLQEPDR